MPQVQAKKDSTRAITISFAARACAYQTLSAVISHLIFSLV
jgi:hypothetical protein